MSLLKDLFKVAAPVVGGIFGGPIGAAVGGALAGRVNMSQPMTVQQAQMMPTMGALPQLGRIIPGVIAGGAIAGRAIGAGMRGAIALCRKHPVWCSQIGGTAVIASMIESGQLPAPRRRRGRGISGRDLRAYRRVHGVLAGFCAPKARIRKP